MWVPHPNTIVSFNANGTGDMGDVTDKGSVARFWLDADRWVLVYLRARFGDASDASGAAGSAAMQLRVDHRLRSDNAPTGTEMPINAFLIDKISAAGKDGTADIAYRAKPEDLGSYTFYRGDALVAEWPNPDTTDIQRWDLEVGLAPVPPIGAVR